MGLRDRLTGLYITNDNTTDVLANLPFFFYLKSTVEQLFLQLVCRNIDIYIVI